MHILYSQAILSDRDREKKIDSCFKALSNASYNQIDINNQILKYYPFYEPYIYQNIINEEKVSSGSLCIEYYSSIKLALLKHIYLLFTNDEIQLEYNLVDNKNNVIYDLKRYNCSGMNNKIGEIDTINQSIINNLVKNYNKWHELLKQNGYSKIFEQKIYPTSFSEYHWVKEIGFTRGTQTTKDILNITNHIINDSTYLKYFIQKQNLRRFFNDTTDKNIIAELALLASINNQKAFTTNVLKFKVISTNLSKREKIFNDFFQEIKSIDNFRVTDFMSKNELLIVLK